MSCYPMQFPAMVAENKTVRCALKFKVTTKGIWHVSEDKRPAANVMLKPSMPVNSGKRRPEISLDAQRWKKQKVGLSKDESCGGTDRQRDRVSVGVSKPPEANLTVKPSMLANSSKQRPEMSSDDQRWKRQKMNCNLKLECSKILKELMNHSLGGVFSEPVDPVKLKIPDYFEIIRNPMDLGTIKHKLERNMYFAAKEFADDVQLTFENAMLYNPPSDNVHHWAKILDGNFRSRWKQLDARLKHTNKNDEDTRQALKKNHQVMKPVGIMKAPVPEKLGNSRRISLEERQKSRPGQMKKKVLVLNEEKNPCSTPASVEGWMADIQISPKRALRVAMLKSRFADTIFKATHPTRIEHDEKSDPSIMQQERLQLEKEQLKEKASIEAQIKAAEVASRRKELDDLKMRRERERKAARIALEKMERTVEIDRPPSMLKDVDILFGGYPNSKSLEQIGLYLKEKCVEQDEAEEGEIF